MSRVHRRLWTAALCALTGLLLPASNAQDKAAGPGDLTPLKTSYEAQVDKINRASEAAAVALQGQYTKSLTTLEKTFQEQGQLDPLLAVKKERERFAADSTVSEALEATGVADLDTLRANYRKSADAVPVKKAQDIVTLTEQYKKSLTGLQEKLTKAGNLEAALETRKETEAVENRPDVSASRFALADAEANKPVAVALPAPATNAPPAKKVAPAAPKKKYTGKAENYIRKRFDDFCEVLVKQDMDKALEFVDPKIVKEEGAERVRARLRFAVPFLQWADRPNVKFSPGTVKVDDSEETASLIPRVFVNNQWHEMPASTWVQRDGDWFMKVEDVPHGEKDFGKDPGPVFPKRFKK